MTVPGEAADEAFRVAGRLGSRAGGPWDVFGESIRRYEIHLNGPNVELVRGPIHLEGYGVRLLRPVEGQTSVGFASATDLSDAGIDRTLLDAETASRYSRFPARSVELPKAGAMSPGHVDTVDLRLWERPQEALDAFVAELVRSFGDRTDAMPSFGSVRATLAEVTIANSEGAERRFARTRVDLEVAVKSSGGAEGAPPGEYWVNRSSVRLDPGGLAEDVGEWCRKAKEVRHASPTPSGELTVVFPAEVLADILPDVLGFRLGGSAELRGMMTPIGTEVGPSTLDVVDDGRFPFGLASAPWDDEGTPQSSRRLIGHGKVQEPLYDLLHASALGHKPTGSGRRDQAVFAPWFHFTLPPGPGPTTVVVAPGDAGSDGEIAEAVRDGLWIDQLGYAFPDPASSAFGGEVRMGYRIRNGRRAEPVRGGTVGGVLFSAPGAPSVLRSIERIGTVGRLVGRLCSPTIAVGRMTVAGSG
jgi:predicted Zn-dependent protease